MVDAGEEEQQAGAGDAEVEVQDHAGSGGHGEESQCVRVRVPIRGEHRSLYKLKLRITLEGATNTIPKFFI